MRSLHASKRIEYLYCLRASRKERVCYTYLYQSSVEKTEPVGHTHTRTHTHTHTNWGMAGKSEISQPRNSGRSQYCSFESEISLESAFFSLWGPQSFL